MTEREILEQEIRNLQCDLTASDYKVIKYTEYVTTGKPAPYDINEVYAERQTKRDRINEIQLILDEMDKRENDFYRN